MVNEQLRGVVPLSAFESAQALSAWDTARRFNRERKVYDSPGNVGVGYAGLEAYESATFYAPYVYASISVVGVPEAN